MTLLGILADAAAGAIAAEAIRPALEPVTQLVGRGMRRAGEIASTVASARMAAMRPRQLVTGFITGKSLWETITAETARWGSAEAWQSGVFEPVNKELSRFEKSTLRPAFQWVSDNPCQSAKMAMFLALGVGDPVTALAPCPPQESAAQQQRATWIRWGVIGLAGAAVLWAMTR